jgi:hypothetical protein
MLAVNTSNHKDTNTHHNNTDIHNRDMERDRRKKAVAVLDRQHIQKENSPRAAPQLFFSLAISSGFMEKSLFFSLLPFLRQY